MRLRTFTAPDMPAAMKMVRDSLGDGAVILATDTLQNKTIRVTAAVEEEDDELALSLQGGGLGGGSSDRSLAGRTSTSRPSSFGTEGEMQSLRYEIQNILRFHNLPELFIAKLMQKATESLLAPLARQYPAAEMPAQALEAMLQTFFTYSPLSFESPYLRVILAGPPGIGKTLTVAKLAARLVMDRHNVMVVTTDNKRAGGVEQLQAFTKILGLQLKVVTEASDLQSFVASLPPDCRLVVDTAGCNPYDKRDIEELKAYCATPTLEPVLVLPAGGDSLETIDIAESFAEVEAKRLLITRTDTARRFGGILAAAATHGIAFCNASSSSSIVQALSPVDSALLTRMLLQYQLNSPAG